jgi:AraC-like DNA-binding protein
VDPLACLLDGSRARDAFVLRSSFRPPWALRIADQAPLSMMAVVRGTAWITSGAAPAQRLESGDVAVLRGPEPYDVSDSPGRTPQAIIDVGQICRTPPGQAPHSMGPQGVRFWGNSPDGDTMLLTGTYRTHPELSQHLLTNLPPALVLPGAEWSNPLVAYLAQESERDEPGQDAVLDRLLDLLLIAVLRAWFARPGAEAPGWYRAYQDPIVGRVLALIHDQPATPWTLASLASASATSRANLARRFRQLVGESPISYLTNWRVSLAADLLAESNTTIEAIARQVGYGDAFALSAAFKRLRGVSPREHRSALTSAG